MINQLLHTNDTWSGPLLRVTLGLAIFPHGAQKLFGWFDGYGFSATMHHFTENMGIPFIFALLAILAESIGALALLLGLLTRVAALGIAATMAVAGVMTYSQHGYFFMNWFGKQAGEGIEYHLLAVGIALALVISGGGQWSLDRLIGQKTSHRRNAA